MNIKFKATKLDMTPALRDYFQEKLDIVEKSLGGMTVLNCDAEIEKFIGDQNKGDIYRAEVNLQLPGELLRVEKTEEDMYKAIDKVKDHLELVIKKHKEKLFDRKKAEKLGAQILPEEDETLAEEMDKYADEA